MDSTLMYTQVKEGTLYTFGSFSHTIPDSLSMMTPTDEEVEEYENVT